MATYWTHDSPPCNHRRPETDSLTPCRCETGPTHDCTSRAISPSAPAQRIHFVCIHQSVDFKRGSRLSLLLDETWTVFSTPSRALEASALPCSSSLQLLSEHYLSTKKATFATPLKFCIDSAGCRSPTRASVRRAAYTHTQPRVSALHVIANTARCASKPSTKPALTITSGMSLAAAMGHSASP